MVEADVTDPVAEEFARQVRARLGTSVRRLVLFGPRARRDHRSDSDYHMLVVVDEPSWEFSPRLPIGLNVAREGTAL